MPDDRNFSTDKLDDAMKELLGICQQYDDKFKDKIMQRSQQPKDTNNEPTSLDVGYARTDSGPNGRRDFPRLNRLFDDQKIDRKHTSALITTANATATQCDKNTAAKEDTIETTGIMGLPSIDSGCLKATQIAQDNSIDRLQQKQCELQRQLDDVLEVAKSLDLKQRKKLNILAEESKEDASGKSSSRGAECYGDDEEEDIELIEFRQIENELRISELNRQLSNIQEQLRLRLYRRLSSRTSSESFKSSKSHQQRTPATTSNHQHQETNKRRDSTQTDESTPSTSSCSDGPTSSSSMSTSNMTNTSTKNSIDTELANQFEKCNLSKQSDAFQSQHCQSSSGNQNDIVDSQISSNTAKPESPPITATITKELHNEEKDDLELAFDQSHNYEVILPLPGPNNHQQQPQQLSTHIPTSTQIHTESGHNIYSNIVNDGVSDQFQRANGLGDFEHGRNYHAAINGFRSCPANNDLERIEEGEEDDNEYCNSENLRMVYESKISPIMKAAGINGCKSYTDDANADQGQQFAKPGNSHVGIKERDDFFKESDYSSPRRDRRFNPGNVNSAKRGNRPLTMYLPKPDENIDLIETVQALGHDLDILSTDLLFTPSIARGYLYKSCSNNNKKWLKRYFHFDRQSKFLSYYENEEQLLKKTKSPKSRIPFDEIGDVYVDHRLNQLNEKQKGSKRKSYVFVLATSKRKYLLASSKPETMRAWIDVLFTAAKANDYFQQVGDDEESLSFNYDSFTGEGVSEQGN